MKRFLLACAALTALQGCARQPAFGEGALVERTGPAAPTAPLPVSPPDANVRSTIVAGDQRLPGAPVRPAAPTPAKGDITLNFPGVDVQDVTKAVLGDILHLQYAIDPNLHAPISLTTQRPVARSAILPLFEEALGTAKLALIPKAGVYAVAPAEQARGQAQVLDGAAPGFGNETIQLQFVNAEEIRKLLTPILPGVVTQADASRGVLVISGTSGQRAAVRDLVRQFDVNWLKGMSFGLFVPQRTDSRLIVPELDKLLNAPDAPTRGLVRLISMERLNGVLAISAQSQYLEDVRRWVEILDREGQNNERRLFVYRVQNGRASDLAKVLTAAFGGGQAKGGAAAPGLDDPNAKAATPPPPPPPPEGAETAGAEAQTTGQVGGAVVTSDDTNNAVVVFGTPRDYAVVEDALRKLDVTPLQVVIEAAITEVTLTDALRYGVQWQLSSGQGEGLLTQNNTPTVSRIAPGFSYFYSNAKDITAALNALSRLTDVNVVSAPKLLVLNNHTASLQVGDQVPVATASAISTETATAPIVNTIEYRDTGVILKVTPRVNSGGLVLLDIAQEVSDVVDTDTSDIDSPTIQTRRVASSIAIQDGQTIALGGLIRDNRSNEKSGLPVLSRIPVVGGALFGAVDNTRRRTELLILLTPRVIRNLDDGEAITRELQEKIRSIGPPPATH